MPAPEPAPPAECAPAGRPGLHLIADLHGCTCTPQLLCDAAHLRRLCLHEVVHAGLQPVGELFHAFPPRTAGEPAGVTGVVLLAESHLALHTWPELGTVTLDIYVCNHRADCRAAARQLLDALLQSFAPSTVQQHELARHLPSTTPLPPLQPHRYDSAAHAEPASTPAANASSNTE